ncbi:MAG: cation-translocating P-type ATPase [Dehalococcoidia bacterium]|nr:cation-translocating P-type ATPase [Dehalococcoidia bacterium]
MEGKAWYNLDVTGVVKSLGSNTEGLTPEEAKKRLAQYGLNELREEKRKISVWSLVAEQFKSTLIIILMAAVVISVGLGIVSYKPGAGLPEEITDAIVIFAIVIACVALGVIEEYRSEKAMEALKKMAALTATVIRKGADVEIPARDVVPGDIVVLSTGDKIPADLRLIEAFNLRTDEASLTGESTPVEKVTLVIEGTDIAIGDRKNMVYSGTTVTYGRGKGIAIATGMQTEFGKIAAMLQEVEEEETPLEKNLDKVGRWLGYACLGVVAIVVGLVLVRTLISSGAITGGVILQMFIWGVSLAVAAVPEALPAVVVISLSIGVRNMVKRHALVRRLSAVETLGCTTVICSDKTGTLTEDQMTVRQIYTGGKLINVSGVGYEPKGQFQLNGKAMDVSQDTAVQTLMRINTLCNDTRLVSVDGVWGIKGDPTEGALVVVSAKAGLLQEETNDKFPRIDEIPFSSERKRMTTIHNTPEGKVAYSKGAPEVILDSCSYILTDSKERPLTEKDKAQVLDTARQMAGEALRLLGMAYKRFPEIPTCREDSETGMVFVGLAGMIDPPREEVKEAIRLCDKAGIKSVMITGDHKLTAMAVAKELGLLKKGIALTGAELDKLTDEEFENKVEDVEVYARVSPAHKLRVIEAFDKKGEIVAMTGDGVNDAPALKKADIGVAMGITGTDVSKEAAAMVLTDDNFASIVAAVEEGRGIFQNIKKYLIYLLSCNVGEVLIMFVAGLMGMALPLLAIHLLWVNLTTDGLPALALSVDPSDPDIMEQPPRDPKSSIFSKNMLITIGAIGVAMAATMVPMFLWKLTSEGGSWRDLNNPLIPEAQTMVLCTMVLFELFTSLACRSEIHSFFKLGLLSNKWLIYANLSSLALLMCVLYIPALTGPFHVVHMGPEDWMWIVPISISGFVIVEIVKLIYRRIGKTARPEKILSTIRG